MKPSPNSGKTLNTNLTPGQTLKDHVYCLLPTDEDALMVERPSRQLLREFYTVQTSLRDPLPEHTMNGNSQIPNNQRFPSSLRTNVAYKPIFVQKTLIRLKPFELKLITKTKPFKIFFDIENLVWLKPSVIHGA